jgi:hypothetical protein
MVTGGFRTVKGMNDALASGACDFVGIARPLAVEPYLPNQLMRGEDVKYAVKPIKTGIKPLDKMAIMEIVWYAAQFKTIADGKQPNPNLSPLKVLFNYSRRNIKTVLTGKLNSRKSA